MGQFIIAMLSHQVMLGIAKQCGLWYRKYVLNNSWYLFLNSLGFVGIFVMNVSLLSNKRKGMIFKATVFYAWANVFLVYYLMYIIEELISINLTDTW